ncbi:MAG: hypothetical protein CSB47_08220 [Proteobacteria bacterium]|nr:MAG: hypothetical protein CSB47_08220 [Pseudomonadota bacterium]
MSTLFFAHANGFPSPSYAPFFKALEQRGYTLDCIEKVGHNPKYPITNNWPYLIEELEQEVLSRHQEPVIGIGHSLGGMLSYLLARKNPAIYSHLILLDPPVINGWENILWLLSKALGLSDHFTPAGSSKNRRTHFETHDHAREHLRNKKLFKDFTDESFESYIEHGMTETEEGLVTLTIDLETELALFRTSPDHLWKFRKPLGIPGLYLTAEDSDFAKRPFAKRLSKTAKMDYRVLKGGHLFPMEHPEETASVIADWLAKSLY